jgi:hypothetical protein
MEDLGFRMGVSHRLNVRHSLQEGHLAVLATGSVSGSPRAADQFTDAPARLKARQAAFYRNLVRLAEQTGARTLPISFFTLDGTEKRMDYGCMKIAEHAGFIEPLANSSNRVVETITLSWNPSV